MQNKRTDAFPFGRQTNSKIDNKLISLAFFLFIHEHVNRVKISHFSWDALIILILHRPTVSLFVKNVVNTYDSYWGMPQLSHASRSNQRPSSSSYT